MAYSMRRKDLFWVVLAGQPYPTLAQNTSFQGDEFSNNLFSDLGPLLALFGERVATQYLRHSTRRIESLIFACAPLGILTAVTSAIRVGGDRRLKAMIGRAEEPEAVAEIELMSSTSADVCELWNGVGLVRVVGKPHILELVIDEEFGLDNSSGDATEGVNKSSGHSYGIYTRKELVPERNDVEQSTNGSLEFIAPNISLNTIGISIHDWEVYLVALCGVILQLGVVAFDALATYHWGWDKGGTSVPKYAFPLTSIGTVGLVYGMYLCAYIIEVSTEELTWTPENSQTKNEKPKQLRILWVQKSQTVGDQSFGSYAIYAPFTETASRRLLTSHRRQEKEFEAKLHKLTMAATALSIGAFILQFVGLRAMHYSASIAQLLVTIIMTVLRVVIRRHISQPPKKLTAGFDEAPAPQTNTRPPGNTDGQQVQFQMPRHKDYAVQELTSGLELDIIALQLQHCRRWQVLTYVEPPPPQQPLHVVQGNAALPKLSETLAQKVFGTRIRLSELVQSPWHTDHEIQDHAQKLSDTIADLANFVWRLGDTPSGLLELEGEFSTIREISWNLLVETQDANSEGPCREGIPLSVQRGRIEGQKWKPWEVDGSRVDALLHLWIQQLRTDNVEDGNMLWLLCPQGDDRAPMIADWWIGRESCIVKGQELDEICREHSIIRSCGAAQGRPDKSRIVGCVGTYKDPKNKTTSMVPEAVTGPVTRAIIQNTTLISFTTQYIFYTFLCKLVDSIAWITPETQIEESTGQGTALLANKAITELAHKMQERGLMGVADAYRMIVCALHAGKKLPLASSEEPNAPSFFNIYNDALELGFRVKRKDIFHEAQEICAIEVEWLLAQNRSAEAAILLIKAIQRCETISLAGENRPGEESWVKGRLRMMMGSVADQFVSDISKPVTGSSSIDGRTNTTPVAPEPLMVTSAELSLEDAICSNEVTAVHKLIKNGAMVNDSLSPSGANSLDCAAREHHRDMIILLHLHGASLTRAPMWWAIEGGNARQCSEGDCLEVMKLLLELGSSPNIAEPHTGQLPLHVAAKSNFAEVVAWLMTESKYDISVGAGDKEGLTALHYAAKGGHGSMVTSLIEVHHADINCGSTTDKKTALHHAAIHGDLVVLEMLCNQVGIDLEARCSEGKSALLYASQKGHYAMIEALASRGADVNAKDTLTKGTGLHLAAMEGHAKTIRLLLDKGGTCDDQDEDGKTALHHAAKEARGLVTYILLSKGASCDLCDKSGKTALDYAEYNLEEIAHGHDSSVAPKAPRAVCEGIVWVLENGAAIKVTAGTTEMQRAATLGDILAVEMLLAIGVDTEEKDNDGCTALIYGAYNGHERVVQALIDSGANIENPNQDLTTPLHTAVENGHELIVRLLLDRGATVNAKDRSGATPLLLAASNGYERVVQLLLEGGAETEVKPNDMNTTPLYLAAWNGHDRVVQLLLEGGADIEGANENGATLPRLAAQSGYGRVVQLLLEAGAQAGGANENGATLLYIAAQNGFERAVELLLGRGAEIEAATEDGATPLYIAARYGNEQVVRLLLEGGAKVDAKERAGATPLCIAAMHDHERVVKLLLEGGAEIEARLNDIGKTPLHIAAENGHERVVRLLLERGAEIEARLNGINATPLYLAAWNGRERVVKLLLERGAAIEAANENGATPLYIAAQNGHEWVVQLLLEGGAEIDVKGCGLTPLYIAAWNGHERVVQLLQDAGAELHVTDSYGRTVLHVATQMQHPAMIKFLIGRGIDTSVRDNAGRIASDYAQFPSDGYELNPKVREVWHSLQSRTEEGGVAQIEGVQEHQGLAAPHSIA